MLDPNKPRGNHALHDDIPQVSETVVKSFSAHLPGFEVLFDALRRANPQLSRYIMTRTEQLASGDIKSKETLARLAVELYGLVTAQHEADQLQALFDAPSEPETIIMTAAEGHRPLENDTPTVSEA